MLEENPDYVLTTCPTCSMALQRDFVDHLRDNPVWAEKAERLSAITMDASKFIVDVLDGAAAFKVKGEPMKVTYHDSCHLKRGAGVWEQPRALLAGAGSNLVEMAHADRCCGFGGSYSFTSHPEIARNILSDKLRDIEGSGAACVAMDCPGCMMQIRGGLEKTGAAVRAAHTISLLAETLD